MRIVLVLLSILVAGSAPATETPPSSPAAFGRRIIAVLRAASTDYADRRGKVIIDNADATLFQAVEPYPEIQPAEQFITVMKAPKQVYYSAAYSGDDAVAVAEMTFTGLASFFAAAPKLYDGFAVNSTMTQAPNGDRSDTVYFHGSPVAFLRIPAGKKLGTLYIGLINTGDRAGDLAKMAAAPFESLALGPPSEHLDANGHILTVSGRGAAFDGDYDLEKLAQTPCVSGSCADGRGRMVLARVTPFGPRIRIIEGNFQHGVYVGGGVMLIDGEGAMHNGTYETGRPVTRNKVVLLSATFHPDGFSEALPGSFNGSPEKIVPGYDDGTMPAHTVLIQYEFYAAEAKGGPEPRWVKEVSQPAQNQWLKALDNSPAMIAAQAKNKIDRAAYDAKYHNQASPGNTYDPSHPNSGKGEHIQTMCFNCGGTGHLAHTENNYSEVNGRKVSSTRTVYEVCPQCHGTGKY